MASIPVDQSKQKPPAESVRERFQRLAAVWRAETSHLSSSTKMTEHPAYREIISMGEEVVPFLLADLAKAPDHWFTALKAITGANPVDPADRGRIDKIANAWLQWGKQNGYQW
jgi:hypothetical protein